MIEIYTDGAYASSRDTGGWAFVVVENDIKIHSLFFPAYETTNNRMEIQAAIEALTWARDTNNKEFTLITDSMYLIGTMTLNWKRNKNNDLWDQLDILKQGLNIEWKHVKGHSGNRYNDLCDALAVEASKIAK